MRVIKRFLLTILAIIFLIEAWIWDVLSVIAHAIVVRIDLPRIKAVLGRMISRMPAFAVLILFVIPAAVVFPFKIGGLWLIANGHVLLGGGTFLLAKVAGMGVAAFLFELCRDKLMEMGWFVRLYVRVMGWRDWAHALVDPVMKRIRNRAAELKSMLLRKLSTGNGGFVRRIMILRQRMRRPERK